MKIKPSLLPKDHLLGAASGRFTCSNVNMCQLSAGEPHPRSDVLRMSRRLLLCAQWADRDLPGRLLLPGGHGLGLAGMPKRHLQ